MVVSRDQMSKVNTLWKPLRKVVVVSETSRKVSDKYGDIGGGIGRAIFGGGFSTEGT